MKRTLVFFDMIKEKDWFRERGYLHLSNKIPNYKRKILEKSLLFDEDKIASHKFKPLIYKEISQRRFKKVNIKSGVIRSHKTIKKGEIVSTKKIRPILYSNHIDANIYAYYAKKKIGNLYDNLLKLDPEFSKCVTAYRRIEIENGKGHKNNIHFAKEVFDEIKKRGECTALAFDIESFFNNLNHRKLKQIWARIIDEKSYSLPKDHYNIFKSVTRFSYIKLKDLKINGIHFDEKKLAFNRKVGSNSFFIDYKDFLGSGITVYKNQRKKIDKELNKDRLIGIPQGLPISAVLANMYMYDFDLAMYKEVVLNLGGFYRRYSDDIMIVCKENQVKTIQTLIANNISELELSISEEKTEKIIFKKVKNKLKSYSYLPNKSISELPENSLTYLGFEFNGTKTYIKQKNLASFYREMKESVKTRYRRIKSINEKNLTDDTILYTRKLFRLYSHRGVKGRKLFFPLPNGGKKKKKYRGNFINYAYKASETMNAPEIKKQVKNHWAILQKTINKYIY